MSTVDQIHRRSRRTSTAGALATLALLAGLAGCSAGDDGAGRAPDRRPAATPTAPGATAPGTRPEAGDAAAEAAAEAAPGAAPGAAHASGPAAPGAAAGAAPWVDKPGFSGPRWADAPTAGVVVVLEDTIAVADEATWKATGLVRNESGADVAGVTVVGQVTAADGRPVGEISADVPVSPLRNGEPAPFQVESASEAPRPFTVTWSARSTPAAGRTRANLTLTTHWSRVLPPGEPVGVAGIPEPPAAAHRYAVFGSVTAQDRAAHPNVTAAWFDDAGKVVFVASAPVVAPGSDRAVADLAPDGLGDFLLVIANDRAEQLAGARSALWGSAQ